MKNELAFYRKYRPTCFAEIVGQDFIIKTLRNSISNNRHSHAYIFSGPKGVGKTSIAKIFSKALNCLNFNGDCCNNCNNCNLINNNQTIDLIEIDAASNNGVSEVRNIIDTIAYLPNDLKTKVYIIDEAHMLTNASWNAFLKSIEEPPKHLVFIFATTEPHKFPPTILSRCQRYNFLKLNNFELKNQISNICKKEEIIIEDSAVEKLVYLSDGSLRDACSILDQLDSYTNSNIKIDDINVVFGLVDIHEKISLIMDIKNNNVENIVNKVKKYENSGANFYQLLLDLIEIIFDKLVYEKTKKTSLLKVLPAINVNFVDFSIDKIILILKIFEENLYNIKNSNNQRFFFEVMCLELTKIFDDNSSLNKVDTLSNKNVLLVDEPNNKNSKNELINNNDLPDSIENKKINTNNIDKNNIDDIISKSIKVFEFIKNKDKEDNNSEIVEKSKNKDELVVNDLKNEKVDKQINEELKKEIDTNIDSLFDISYENSKNNYILENVVKKEQENQIDKNDFLLRVFVNNNPEKARSIEELINKIKSKTPTNLIEANIKDIKKVIAVSNNGIVLLANDNINSKTINDLSTTVEFLEYIKLILNKIYYVISITKKELDEFVKNNLSDKKKIKKDVEDIDIDFIEKKMKPKSLASEIAEELLGDLIADEE